MIACLSTIALAANPAYAQEHLSNPYKLGADGRCYSPAGEAVSRDWCVSPDPIPYKLGADGKCYSPNGIIGFDAQCRPRDPRLPPLPYRNDATGQCRAADGQLVRQGPCLPQPVSPGPWKLNKSGQCLAKDGEPVMMQFCQPSPGSAPPSNVTSLRAVAIPALQQRADRGDVQAQCAILQLYVTGQAKPRPNDDLSAMHHTCAKLGYEASGQPPPPALLVPPPTIMLNLPGPDIALVVERPTDKQIADAGSSIPGGSVNGFVFVKCQIQHDGSLSGCTVPIEHPAGKGLGDVGLGLSKLIRMNTQDSQGHSVVGLNVEFRFAFQDAGAPRP